LGAVAPNKKKWFGMVLVNIPGIQDFISPGTT
jgi:hypothetical protein